MKTLEDFVRESNRIEGIHREPFPSEILAHKTLVEYPVITVEILEKFVSVIELGAVLRREYGMNVRVGAHYPPLGGSNIERVLNNILDIQSFGMHHLAFKQHIEYETLHPFTDGNGRSGRALWLWAMHGEAPLGFLHRFYYQALENTRINK